MPRNLHLFAACAIALIFCLPGSAQDAPSLGDLARQAQKDKANANASTPVAKVLTNDDLPSRTGAISMGAGGGTGRVVHPGTPGNQGAAAPGDELQRMESMLNELDSVDRATLAKNVLQGNEANFPGRAKWEEQLFAAKQIFVARGRDILKKANQLQASAKSVQDVKNTNDPRAKDLDSKLQQLMQEQASAGADFQAVVNEGRDLATKAAPH